MKRSPIKPGKKCSACNGTGGSCVACNGVGRVFAKPKARKHVKAVSAKRQTEHAQYSALRRQFMLANPRCQVLGPSGAACGCPSTDCHHIKGRGPYYLSTETWLSTCSQCHEALHVTHRAWAGRMGYIQNSASNNPFYAPSTTFLPYAEPTADASNEN